VHALTSKKVVYSSYYDPDVALVLPEAGPCGLEVLTTSCVLLLRYLHVETDSIKQSLLVLTIFEDAGNKQMHQ
jgi:hypothetical protein